MDYLNDFCSNSTQHKNKITKQSLLNISNYFKHKFTFTEAHRWAYYFKKGIAIGVNMAIERFHSLQKVRFAGKHVVRVGKLIHILFQLGQNESIQRYSFAIHPKIDNMPYKTQMNLEEFKILVLKYSDFSFATTSEIISYIEYEIIERNCQTLTLNEGRFFLDRSREKGTKTLVTMTSISDLLSVCKEGCNINLKGDRICWHSGQCSCSTFFVKHIACRHIFFLAFEFRFQEQRKLDKTPIICNSFSILSGLDQTSSFQPIRVHETASDIEHPKELNDVVIESDIYLKITGKALNLSRAKSLFSTFKTKNKIMRKKCQDKIDLLKSNLLHEEKTLRILESQSSNVEHSYYSLEQTKEHKEQEYKCDDFIESLVSDVLVMELESTFVKDSKKAAPQYRETMNNTTSKRNKKSK